MDLIINIRELYQKSRKYLEEESKNDPETEPFRSKYKAMEYLKEIKEKITGTIADSTESSDHLYGMLAVVHMLMGSIHVDTEELSAGEKSLNEALIVAKSNSDPRFVLVGVMSRNQLGILWCHRSDHEKAKTYLEESERIFNTFMSSGKGDAMSCNEQFDDTEETRGSDGSVVLEKEHTLTKFYLAQVYGKLGKPMKSALYCHETLRRQLESKEYDSVDWALNSATLSQYFMEHKLYSQSRHHLAAASFILDRYQDQLKSLDLSEDEMEAKKEELRHRSADVSRCWAKLGIFILEQSKDSDCEILNEPPEMLQNCWFSSLELGEYETQMADETVRDFESARDMMLVTQRYLVAAKEYYTLEDHASDFVQIAQDHSALVRHLSWFEKDESRLCKMLKKRINMLEDVVKEINPKFYLHACRAMWFELGEAYHDLMAIKHKKIRESQSEPNPSALSKANQLADQSMRNFKLFLDSVKNKENKLPDPLPEDLLRPTLVAHFYLGQLHYKLFSPDKRQVLQNTYEAYSSFKYLVDYCNGHPKGMLAVSDEFEISEEMMSLLQLKIKQSVNTLA